MAPLSVPGTRRFDTPWPYSWAMTSPSMLPSRYGRFGRAHMYICMRAVVPSPSVPKLALFRQRIDVWRHGVVHAAEVEAVLRLGQDGIAAVPLPLEFATWKLPLASSKPKPHSQSCMSFV